MRASAPHTKQRRARDVLLRRPLSFRRRASRKETDHVSIPRCAVSLSVSTRPLLSGVRRAERTRSRSSRYERSDSVSSLPALSGTGADPACAASRPPRPPRAADSHLGPRAQRPVLSTHSRLAHRPSPARGPPTRLQSRAVVVALRAVRTFCLPAVLPRADHPQQLALRETLWVQVTTVGEIVSERPGGRHQAGWR